MKEQFEEIAKKYPHSYEALVKFAHEKYSIHIRNVHEEILKLVGDKVITDYVIYYIGVDPALSPIDHFPFHEEELLKLHHEKKFTYSGRKVTEVSNKDSMLHGIDYSHITIKEDDDSVVITSDLLEAYVKHVYGVRLKRPTE